MEEADTEHPSVDGKHWMVEMLLSPVLCFGGVLRDFLVLAAPTCHLWQWDTSVESQMLPKGVIFCEKFQMGYCKPGKILGRHL